MLNRPSLFFDCGHAHLLFRNDDGLEFLARELLDKRRVQQGWLERPAHHSEQRVATLRASEANHAEHEALVRRATRRAVHAAQRVHAVGNFVHVLAGWEHRLQRRRGGRHLTRLFAGRAQHKPALLFFAVPQACWDMLLCP
jgi:hypothetical protein